MPSSRAQALIETEAIVVAYAMSRLDAEFLRRFQLTSWREAFATAGRGLDVPASSMKNLRDEFDPMHANLRKGWHKRPLRPNRQRVLAEFCDISDEALLEIVTRILGGDSEVAECISKPLTERRERVENVAERLRTGRLAEEYFLHHAEEICGVSARHLVDVRNRACGFDFMFSDRPNVAIEVKGMKTTRGAVLFTDYEWKEASRRQTDYWLVVIGSLVRNPRHRLIENPTSLLRGQIVIRTAPVVSWRLAVAVA